MRLGSSLLIACALMTSASAEGKRDKVQAKKHYDLGKAHYNLNDWDKAIAEFEIAYRLFPDPVNLYNIAQAYRLKTNHCADAAEYYARYQIAEKNRKLRDSVDQVRKQMEDCAKVEKEKAAEPLPVPPLVPAAGTPPPANPAPINPGLPQAPPAPFGDNAMRPFELPDPDPNRNRRILSYVLMGTGGGLVLIGIGFSFQLADLETKLEGCDDFGCDSGDDPATLKERRDRANKNASASYGTGFLALITGGVIYLVSRKPKTDKPAITAVPMRGGAGLSWKF